MLVHILREANAVGIRVEDDVEEALLVKNEGGLNDDNEETVWTEYRFPGSDVIVHRSSHVRLKKGLQALAKAKHLDLDRWARDVIDDLVTQRETTGAPVEMKGQFTPEEQAALERVLAQRPGLGALTVDA